jgi:hypothetical protein
MQRLARRLGAIDPAYERLRPDPGMRKFEPGDFGPIVDMPTAKLEDLIDRYSRFDPPELPAPVGPMGYHLLYRNDLTGVDPSFLSVSARVGEYGGGRVENRIGIRPDNRHALWRDLERGIEALHTVIEIWNPLWACAYAVVDVRAVDGEVKSRVRPWLAWTARPLQPRPNPPYARPYPAPFPLDDAGPAAEVRSWQGGELKIWP